MTTASSTAETTETETTATSSSEPLCTLETIFTHYEYVSGEGGTQAMAKQACTNALNTDWNADIAACNKNCAGPNANYKNCTATKIDPTLWFYQSWSKECSYCNDVGATETPPNPGDWVCSAGGMQDGYQPGIQCTACVQY